MSDYTLALDGSTYAGSVALIRGRDVVAELSLPDSGIPVRAQRGEDFMPMVVECLASQSLRASEVSRVVCGAGPGSFTSLRIAASIAKGIAVGVGCPLFAVSSLKLVAMSADIGDGHCVATLPAMRGESFALDFSFDAGGIVWDGPARLGPTETITREAASRGASLIAPGGQSWRGPRASSVAKLLDEILTEGPVDTHTWEPDYGRLAEAQVKWESAHGRKLAVDG